MDIFWVISHPSSYSGHEATKQLMSCFHEDVSWSPSGVWGETEWSSDQGAVLGGLWDAWDGRSWRDGDKLRGRVSGAIRGGWETERTVWTIIKVHFGVQVQQKSWGLIGINVIATSTASQPLPQEKRPLTDSERIHLIWNLPWDVPPTVCPEGPTWDLSLVVFGTVCYN